MRYASGCRVALAVIGSLCMWSVQGAAAREHATVASTYGNDIFMAGSNVRLNDGSAGDAMLAGGFISTSGAVQGDEVATGGQINLGADVAGGLYAAGGRVRCGRAAPGRCLPGPAE